MNEPELIGLLPAGGRATRLLPLPCSKEIYPIGLRESEDGHGARSKVVSHYLLEKMRRAGARKAFIVLRDGKWDIPSYYNDGTALLDMHLAYIVMRLPYGPPFTVDQAYPFVRDAHVAFGFPDILFEPDDAFVRLLERQAATRADVVLGVLMLQSADVVDDRLVIGPDGRVERIEVKSRQSDLPLTWVAAVWTPVFTEFLHVRVAAALSEGERLPDGTHRFEREMIMGDVMAPAVEGGLHINTVFFQDARFLDIGTPEGLLRSRDSELAR